MTNNISRAVGSGKKADANVEIQQQLFEMDVPENVPLQPTVTKVYSAGRVHQIPITDLHPDPAQPRKYFDPKDLESLAQSMLDQGVIMPIIFRVADDGKLVLVAGERRWRAAAIAGLDKLPAILNSKGSPELVSLIENVSRCNLNPVELSEALNHLKRDKGMIDADLTKIFGWASSTISEIRSLRKLPASVRDDCRMRSDVTMDVLVLIARKDDESEMVKAYQDYLAGKTTRSSLKKGKGGANFTVGRYITSVEKRFNSINVDTLSVNDRATLGQSLDRLITSLQNLRQQVGATDSL